MNIAVVGLWHLGCVTSACLAEQGHQVIAFDPDLEIISRLSQNRAPIFEPGLDILLTKGKDSGKLRYSSNLSDLKNNEIVWVTFDTPVDENDIADTCFVINNIENIFPYLSDKSLIIISSQIPVGTTRQLQEECISKWPNKNITFAYIPENLRLGKAIEVFTKPDRFIVGLSDLGDKIKIQNLFFSFTNNLIFMSIESAEMAKHALNAFLATSVVFINELATLCESVGADAREVELALKSEERIGPKAYLRPGGPIGGGTLLRDVNYLIDISRQKKFNTSLFPALLNSNLTHKQWSCKRIIEILKTLKDKTITILGLTYKSGTNTLNRSPAIETCQWLQQQGANVFAFDPAIKELPNNLSSFIKLAASVNEAIHDTHAIIIATEWPEFTKLTVDEVITKAKQPFIFDPSGFLFKNLGQDKRVRYFSVGGHA